MTSAHSSEDVRIFHKECVSLAKAGYEVFEVAHGDSYDKNGVHIVGIGKPPANRLKRMTKAANAIYRKALELDCDIYHFHDPELLPYGLKLKKKGKIVIFDSHENTVEQIMEKTWIPALIRGPMYSLFDWYQTSVCRRLDGIISVTPHICDYFMRVNPNTCMITNYPILQPEPEHAERMPDSLCFAGGISTQWNHDRILQAMEKVPNSRYILCGSKEDAYLEKLRGLPAWERVDFRGKLPHEQINQLLASCQIGMAVLSYNHNTGFKTGTIGNTKIFEEMMAGLPVVCTDFDLWREILERWHCGICVNPESVEEIANAIQYLLDHPEEAKRMGENGRKAVAEEFNWSIEEKKLIRMYEGLLD